MWCTTFAFEPWHSAIEFRRYLNRFVHLFKTFDTMSGIYRTRFNQYDSIVRPLQAWLRSNGVRFLMNTTVTDVELAAGDGITATALVLTRDGGAAERIPLAPEDLVFVTNGSMTANSTLGTTDTPAVLDTSAPDASWRLWQTLAAKRPHLGDPRCSTPPSRTPPGAPSP